jgi:hypothetical protein
LKSLASVLLIAPSTYHRLRFREPAKEALLYAANLFVLAGIFLIYLLVDWFFLPRPVPPALLLWINFGDAAGIFVVVAPVLVMASGQLAGGLAWLAISGEDAHDLVGVVTGVAWTASGGELMFIEALRMPGTGRLIITGLLGDVMRESVNAAYSYVRSRAAPLGIPNNAFPDNDIHIHFPVGATPKDGPSAGVAMFTAIASLFSQIPVRWDVAMTGTRPALTWWRRTEWDNPSIWTMITPGTSVVCARKFHALDVFVPRPDTSMPRGMSAELRPSISSSASIN